MKYVIAAHERNYKFAPVGFIRKQFKVNQMKRSSRLNIIIVWVFVFINLSTNTPLCAQDIACYIEKSAQYSYMWGFPEEITFNEYSSTWVQYPTGTNLSYTFNGLICSKTLSITVQGSGTDSDSDFCTVSNPEQQGAERYKVDATFYPIPKLIVQNLNLGFNCTPKKDTEKFTFSVDIANSSLCAGGKVTAVYLQIADNNSFSNANSILLTSGTATLSYSDLAGANKSAWYGKWLYFRPMFSMANGNTLYGSRDFLTKFYPVLSFDPDTVIKDLPKCAYGSPTIKIPVSSTEHYVISIKIEGSGGQGYNYKTNDLGSPINGYYVITESSPCLNSPNPDYLFGNNYELYIEQSEFSGTYGTPCAYKTGFYIRKIPEFRITQYDFGFNQDDNSGKKVQISKRGEKGRVNLSIVGSCSSSITIKATRADGQIFKSNVTLDTPYKVDEVDYYKGNTSIDLPAGIYTVEVSSTYCNYTVTSPITLAQPDTVTFTVSSTKKTSCNTSCSSGNTTDGEITVSGISGGFGNFTLSCGTSSFQGVAVNNSRTFNNQAHGDHYVTVTDEKGNYSTQSVTVLQPVPVTFSASETGPSMSCLTDGTVTVSGVSGGTGPNYTFSNDNSNFQSSTTIGGYSSGNNKVVYVKDKNACVFSKEVPVPPAPPRMSISAQNSTPPSCNGQNDGQYQCTVSNVFGVLSAADLDSRISSGNVSIVGNMLTISGLGAGTGTESYSITLVDTKNGNSCTLDTTFTIDQKPAISITSSAIPVKDKGTSTGSITVNATGGNAGVRTFYLYGESNKSALIETKTSSLGTVTFSNLSGSFADGGKPYYIDVVDVNSCSYFDDNSGLYMVRVQEPQDKLKLSYTITNPIDCHGNSNADVSLSASGGWTQQYLYSRNKIDWADNELFNDFSAGSHKFYVTDYNGGKDSVEVYFSQPPKLTASLDSTRNVLCKGENTGWLRYNVSGGTFPYSFTPLNGSSTAFRGEDTLLTATNLTAKTWSFQVKDRNGCLTSTFSNVVTEPDILTIPFTFRRHTSCELPNGVLMARASGGTPPYKYQWKNVNGDFEQTVAGLSGTDTSKVYDLKPDTYIVVVTDKNGCSVTSSSLTIDTYTNPTIIGHVSEDVKCYDESNGTIRLTGQKGNSDLAEYTLLANGSGYSEINTTGYFENLKADTYYLYVIDVKGCRSNSPRRVDITQPDTTVYLNLGQIQPALNKGSKTGGIQATVFGGNDRLKEVKITNFDGTWSSTSNQIEGFSFILDQLYAGKYTLLATDSKGCSGSLDNIIVTEPQFHLKFKDVIVKNALCKAQTGSIEVQAEGGWGDYSYNGPSSGTNFYSLNKFENLNAGNYIITVQDKLGATFSDTVAIYEPKDSLRSWVSNRLFPTCSSNGEITLAFKGGTVPYHVFDSTNRVRYSSTSDKEFTIKGLSANNYKMQITDGNGCLYNLDAVLPKTQMLNVSFADPVYPSAAGSADGAINAEAQGGVIPYSFQWKERFGSVVLGNTASLTNVPSGYYELMVSEKGGCSVTKTYYLPGIDDYQFKIAKFENETSFGLKNGYCKLTSLFNNWKEFEFITPSNKLHFNSGESNSQFSYVGDTIFLKNLEGGTYFVLGLTNKNEKVYVTFEIEPYKLFFVKNVDVKNVKKIGDSNGSIALTVEGGGGGNVFEWKRISTPQSSVLTAQNSPKGSILSNIPAGKYEVTVTDYFKNIITQTIDVIEPSHALKVTIVDSENISCKNYNNGSVTFNAVGGWGNYQFKDDINDNYLNGNLHRDSSRFVNLTPRSHKFFIIDKLGVVDSLSIPITEPDYLRSSVAFIDSVNCKGENTGEVKFHVTGGTKPYKFAYANNPTFWYTDTVARNIPLGEYNYIFSDKNNCPTQDVIPPVKMLEPESLLFSKIDVTHTTCNTDNGKIEVNLKGGSKPYRYEWFDAGNQNIGAASSLAQLSRNGFYKLNVYDRYNCYQHFDTIIKPSSNPVVTNIDTTPVLCYGGSTGTAIVKSVKAGSPYAPYTFKWSNGDSDATSKGYKKGVHSVTVTDTNKCSTTSYFEVTQPDLLRISITDRKNAHCFGYNDAFLQAQGLGGVGNYTYKWSTGVTANRIDNLYRGDYRLTIKDANGCETVESFTIIEPDKLEVDLGDDIKMCPGNSRVIDGQEFASHKWSNSSGVISNERYLTVRDANSYYLEVTDNIGCFAWDTLGLSIGNDALKADFLLSSQAEVGDTLSIYELSNMVIDSVSWYYNHDAFTEVDNRTGLDYAFFLKTLKTGIYNIELSAFSGGCISTATKQIEIIADSGGEPDDDDLGYKDPLIKSFAVNPNPNDGNFYAEVKLREVSSINLVLFSVASGLKMDERFENQLSEYSVGYNLTNLNSGVYLLILKAGNERKQVKIIIQ